MNPKKNIFVIMPFRPEFHYFYLYLKNHVEKIHNVDCIKADEKITGEPFLDKIKGFISHADVLIVDCTGGNPNVFYELGIGHSERKKIIHITQDKPDKIPSDNRHRDFIIYEMEKTEEFFNKLDKAINYLLVQMYEEYYEHGKKILDKFMKEAKTKLHLLKKETFINNVKVAESTTKLPALSDKFELSKFVYLQMTSTHNSLTDSKFYKWVLTRK
jgi:hypothetical protein